MDFRLSDEQQMFKDSLTGWLMRHSQIEHRDPPGRDRWSDFARMGWLGVAIPAEYGGLGFGAVEQMIIAEAFGAHLTPEPFVSTVLMSAGLLLELGSPEQQCRYLPPIAGGEAKLAFAYAERSSRYRLGLVSTRARRKAGRYILDGEKIVVLDAPGANWLFVSARTSGAEDDEHGVSLFLVDPKAFGLGSLSYETIDGRMASDLVFDGVEAELIVGAEGRALAGIEAVADRVAALLCAKGVGAMQALLDTTLAYVKVRGQFGRPIGDFQVIQHRIVDMRIELECARAAAIMAACLSHSPAISRKMAVSAAKVQLARSAKFIGSNAIQLHGGIGMTEELPVGRHFRHLRALQSLLGDADFHRARFAELSRPGESQSSPPGPQVSGQ